MYKSGVTLVADGEDFSTLYLSNEEDAYLNINFLKVLTAGKIYKYHNVKIVKC